MPIDRNEPHNQKIDDAYASYIAETNNKLIKRDLSTVVRIILGSFLMAYALTSFVKAGGFLSGGFTGIILLIQRITKTYLDIELPFTPLSVLFNIFPAYLAYKTVGKRFTLFSCVCFMLISVLTDILPSMPLTDDPLLISIFGGIINGFGASIVLNSGASSGGTDFLSMYFSVKKGISVWNYMMACNIVLILISGVMFGMNTALYTIIYQYVSTQVINALYKKYYKKTFFIVTDKPQEVSDAIMSVSHHGATMIEAEGAYTDKKRFIVYTIVGTDQVPMVRKKVRLADAEAFINVMNSDMVTGNFYQTPIG